MSRSPVTLTELSEDECWALLAGDELRLARVGFVADGATVIHPMNYALAGRRVYLRTGPTTMLADAVGRPDVAFEVDVVDPDWQRGWSVLLQGRLHGVVDDEELERNRELPLRTWAPGRRLHLLRFDADHVSGRRIA